MTSPAIELTRSLEHVTPGRALDLACGRGRHAIWLRDKGWQVTAVDQVIAPMEGITCVQADLEQEGFAIEPQAWDLIVVWLYWQSSLLPAIAKGIIPGGIVALAGKMEGRFATSLANYREAFQGWHELSTGEDHHKAHFIARRTQPPQAANPNS